MTEDGSQPLEKPNTEGFYFGGGAGLAPQVQLRKRDMKAEEKL